jgi:LuxR family maltose regulon positive regulatory protein
MKENQMVEQPSLLKTKFYAPSPRPELVERKRLLDELNANLTGKSGFSRKLTLITAPAGYGKTTLACQWLETVKVPVAWLSLEADDNDPTRFIHYLIAALQTVHPDLGSEALAMLEAQQRPPDDVLITALINDLSTQPELLILVLDDYHVIRTPTIHKQLASVLDHQPANFHLVVATREDPLIPIPRLRARGKVLEIRQADLRFTIAETAEFLERVMGLSISSDEIAALERRTEGWIAGLQLAALSMRGRADLSGFIQAFTGSSRFILDFLIEEVFERQSPEVKDFLIKTSILDRLSGPLCDSVAEETGSQNLLEALEQANLFIVPLDQSRTWYRYHRLFGELLRNRLRAAGQPSEMSLHLRAREWFEKEGLVSEAIQHALAAQDWGRAAALIGQASDGLLKRGELVTLISWCQRIPDQIIRAQPDFGMSYVWGLLLIGRFEEAEELLNHYEEEVGSIPDALGQVATAQAYAARARGDNKRVIEKSEQALALLPENEFTARSTLALNLGLVYWHEGRLREAVPVLNEAQELATRVGNHYAGLTAQIFLARTRASQGALKQAEEMLQTTLQVGGMIPILVLSHYDLSCIYYEWNDLGKAWAHLNQGMDICMRSGNAEFQNAGHMLKAIILMAQGNMLGALAEVETSHALSQEFGPATIARSMACHAQIALAMGDVTTAEQWVEKMSEDVDAHSLYRFIGLTQARLLLARGEKEAARQLLAERLAKATQAGWGYATIAIRALQALTEETEEAALNVLAEVLMLSQPEGFIRTYVDTGNSLVPLFKEAARRGITPEYIGRILDAYDAKRKEVALPLVEPLSERELEVLRLVTAGLSNREIAEKLVISIGTAKTHVHNICGKLGVRNRTEAAMQAKELGLV